MKQSARVRWWFCIIIFSIHNHLFVWNWSDRETRQDERRSVDVVWAASLPGGGKPARPERDAQIWSGNDGREMPTLDHTYTRLTRCADHRGRELCMEASNRRTTPAFSLRESKREVVCVSPVQTTGGTRAWLATALVRIGGHGVLKAVTPRLVSIRRGRFVVKFPSAARASKAPHRSIYVF